MSDEKDNDPALQNRTRTKEEILGILKGESVPPAEAGATSLPSAVDGRTADDKNAAPPVEPQGAPTTGSVADVKWTEDQVKDVLRGVYDPEIHINIVDLGLVYGVAINGSEALVRMSLTSPGCPYGPYLIHQVKDTVQSLKGITKADVEVVWDPPWGPAMMTEEVRLELGFDV